MTLGFRQYITGHTVANLWRYPIKTLRYIHEGITTACPSNFSNFIARHAGHELQISVVYL